jgi:hypothetical protein
VRPKPHSRTPGWGTVRARQHHARGRGQLQQAFQPTGARNKRRRRERRARQVEFASIANRIECRQGPPFELGRKQRTLFSARGVGVGRRAQCPAVAGAQQAQQPRPPAFDHAAGEGVRRFEELLIFERLPQHWFVAQAPDDQRALRGRECRVEPICEMQFGGHASPHVGRTLDRWAALN